MKIFISDGSVSATEQDIKKAFEAFGAVKSMRIKKKAGDNSRWVGLINMPDDMQAQAAIEGLNGKDFMGRAMRVEQRREVEKPRKDYKEIKRLRREGPEAVIIDKPLVELPEVKPKVKRSAKKLFSRSRSNDWLKRKGKGASKAWKKTPGGVKKKFNVEK